MQKYFLSSNLLISTNISNDYLEFIELNSIKDKFKNVIDRDYNDSEAILYSDEKFYKRTNLDVINYLNTTKAELLKSLEKKDVYAGFKSEKIYMLDESTLVSILDGKDPIISIFKEKNISLEEILLNYRLFGNHYDINKLFLSNKAILRAILKM